MLNPRNVSFSAFSVRRSIRYFCVDFAENPSSPLGLTGKHAGKTAPIYTLLSDFIQKTNRFAYYSIGYIMQFLIIPFG